MVDVAGLKTGKGVRIALAVSVALNLLIVGLLAGAVLRDGGPRARMLNDLEFGPFTEALTEQDRKALRRDFVERMPDMRDMRRQMRADFGGLLAALRAEPFDAGAVRALMAGQSARMAERLQLGQELLVERIGAMTPKERADLADRLEERLQRGPDKRRGGGGG